VNVRVPILWFSKHQAAVKSSTFGLESLTLQQAIDMFEGLCYKLRMMSIPIDGNTQVYCDKDLVVKATMRPESAFKK
jgi:hypothetical protein